MKTYTDLVLERLPAPGAVGVSAWEVGQRLGQGVKPTLVKLRELKAEGLVACRVGIPDVDPWEDEAVCRWTLAAAAEDVAPVEEVAGVGA